MESVLYLFDPDVSTLTRCVFFSEDTYLTAATELERPEATGQADNPYHCEMIPCEMIPQEPKY